MHIILCQDCILIGDIEMFFNQYNEPCLLKYLPNMFVPFNKKPQTKTGRKIENRNNKTFNKSVALLTLSFFYFLRTKCMNVSLHQN